MARKRLTREDSREQTLQRLIDSAKRLIAKKGFSATSVEDIAEDAGYSRGAFYSNFGGKDDLFIELLRRDHAAATQEFLALMDDSIPLEAIQARARDLYGCIYRDHEQFMFWTEARLRSARDARFRAKLNVLMLEKRAWITRFIEYFYRRAESKPPIPPALMAMGFMSLVEGVTMLTLSSPMDMTGQSAEAILRHYVDSTMQLARMEGAAGATIGSG